MTEKSKKNKIAWSDDLSYDSEEEREKERLALAELAEIETPEKPSYSEDELDQLVNFTKRITTLYRLQDTDWNDACLEVIQQYFMEPKNILLCIYFDNDILTALLNVPLVPFYDITYFLRQPDMIFSVDNFYDEVIFGTIVESVEGSLLKVLEIVYAPVLQSMNAWPNNVKNKLNGRIHEFLARLTDRHYKSVGQTVVYIPREGLDITIEVASSDEQLVKRLENVVINWIKQIKSCLEDCNIIAFQNQLICPLNELNFWVYRHENLSGLMYQIENENVKHLSNILKNAHSSCIKQFQYLCNELKKSMTETTSNIEYLQILKNPCTLMATVKSSDELPAHISNILNLFRFVWTESPYYNTEDKVTKLCSYLSNQVIIQCTEWINLKDLFNGKTRTAIEELHKSIECCKAYVDIYNTVSDAHNTVNSQSWKLNAELIFNYIDTFVQRCVDMLEVCNGMIIFGRIDEEKINMPRFGGTKGKEFENKCKDIEEIFREALKKVENAKQDIFNVHALDWYNNILEFRNTTKYIEVLIENLVLSLFKEVNNVEEAVQILGSTFNYLKRGNLNNCLIQNTSYVWNIFLNEIETTKRDMANEREMYPAGMPIYAGQALQLYVCKHYLIHIKQIMDTAIWIPKCSNSANVLHEYKKVIVTIDECLLRIWTLWKDSIDNDSLHGLNRMLICYSNIKAGLLECNFDRNTMREYKESYHWENIQFEIPPDVLRVYLSVGEVKLVYEDCLLIVSGYNRILTSLSEEEVGLFRPLINECLTEISDGILKFKWNSINSDVFLVNCTKRLNLAQLSLTKYKACNIRAVKLIEDICGNPLIMYRMFNLSDIDVLQNGIKDMMQKTTNKILIMYKNIIKYIAIVFEVFEEFIEEIPYNWLKYILQFDNLLETAVTFNIRTTMKNMYKNLSGDGIVGPLPLLNVLLNILNEEICLIPDRNQIFSLFCSIFQGAIENINAIPRLCVKFGLPNEGLISFDTIIEKDIECLKYQELIIMEINKALQIVNNHLDVWNGFKHIWKIPIKEFLEDYASQKPATKEFDKDVIRYVELANDIQMKENTAQVNFILLNCSLLKILLNQRCNEWQEEFGEARKISTQKDIKAIYAHIKNSGDFCSDQPSTYSLMEFQDMMDSYDRSCKELLL